MSIGNIKDYTPNFKFIIPSFDIATWHDYIEENFRNIDALFYNLFGINNYSGTWKNITSYTVGQVLFVGEDKDLEGNDTDYAGRLVKVLIDHTTDNSDYFNIYYNLHPEYYELFADASTAQYYAQIAQNNANATSEMKLYVESYLRDTENLRNETQILTNDAEYYKNLAEERARDAKTSADTAQVSAINAQDYLNLTQETYYNAVNEVNSAKSDAIIQIDNNADQKIAEFDNLATQNTQTATNLLKNTQIAAQNAQNYANEAWGKISNVGDIFYSLRLDDELNGAVVCNGNYYELEDFTGTHSIKNLLEQNKLPYVSLDEYENTLNTYGSVRCFGYDVGGTQFRVPTLDDVYIKAGIANLPNEFNVERLPNITGSMSTFATSPSASTTLDSVNKSGAFIQSKGTQLKESLTTTSSAAWARTTTMNFNASDSNSTYQDNAKVNPDNIRYRAFVQLANATTENAIISATSAISKLADASYKSKDETYSGQKIFEKETKFYGGTDDENNLGQIRIFNSDKTYSAILRFDGSRLYLLLTNKNDANGSWNDLRPLVINPESGSVSCITPLRRTNNTVVPTTEWVMQKLYISTGTRTTLSAKMNAAFTIPDDGYLILTIQVGSQTNSTVSIHLANSGTATSTSQTVCSFQHNGGSAELNRSPIMLPVKKGQSIYLAWNNAGNASVASAYLYTHI